MLDFISEIIACDDFELLLGDLYQPCCCCIVVSWCILSFGAVCGAFQHIFAALFAGVGGGGKH